MKIIQLKQFVLSLIAMSAIAMFSSCKGVNSPNSDTGCGDAQIADRLWRPPSWGNYKPDTYTLGSERYYNFFIPVDSICPDKHINMHASALFDIADRRIQFRTAVEWSIFFENIDTGKTTGGNLGFEDSLWTGAVNGVGLKQSFADQPAKIFANIYVHFPTVGSQEQDSLFLLKKIKELYVSVSYNYFKPKK